MKIIITEEQNERIKDLITIFLKSHFTPKDGWLPLEEYQKELNLNDGLLLINFDSIDDDDIIDYDDYHHMAYQVYDEDYDSYYSKEECPVAILPDENFNELTEYFGDIWKPIFIEWFTENTGLPLKTVKSFKSS